jgi:hypothetical protein
MSNRPWWQPLPFDHSSAEMLLMRLAFAVTAFMNVKWETRTLVEQKFPHGLAHFMDLTWLATHPPALWLQVLVAIALIPYILGRWSALSLLPLWGFSILIGTLVTSQSERVNHTWQLISLILSAQFLVYAWAWLKDKQLSLPAHKVHQRVIHASLVVFAASYVSSGLTKLIASKGSWIADVPLLAVQVMKTNWSNHYDTLAALPEWLNDGTRWMLESPNQARLFFGWGLVIELAGFVVLISRRWALGAGLAIIAFHLGVSFIMRLHFEYHILAALIFCVNLPGLGKTLRGAQ